MPLFLPSEYHYQQTISGHHKINLSRKLQHLFLYLPNKHTSYIFHIKKNYKALSRSLRFHLVKDNTISSSKAPILNVKLITYMNNYNGFDLLIYVVFSMSPQLGGRVPKAKDLVISSCLDEGETLPQFHLRYLQIRS